MPSTEKSNENPTETSWSSKVEAKVQKDSRIQPWKSMFTEEVNNKTDKAPDFTLLEPGQPMTNGVGA